MQDRPNRGPQEGGFTLMELLVTIVVIGILAGVAILGLYGLNGTASGSACQATMDAASAASATYYSRSGGTYPQNFSSLTNPSPPLLQLRPGITVSPSDTALSGNGTWTLQLIPGPTATDKTTFSC